MEASFHSVNDEGGSCVGFSCCTEFKGTRAEQNSRPVAVMALVSEVVVVVEAECFGVDGVIGGCGRKDLR